MTPQELATHLRKIHTTADAYRQDLPQVVEGIGDAYVTLDPTNDSAFPSTNLNAVHFLGCTTSVTSEDVGKAVTLFSDAGCRRFFFWLSPSDQSDEIRSWLPDHGLKPFEGTDYPTLLRPTGAMASHETTLGVRQLTGIDARSRKDELSKVLSDPWPEFIARTADAEGFDHFGVFAADQLVGVGGLSYSEDVGWPRLGRRRGIPSATRRTERPD